MFAASNAAAGRILISECADVMFLRREGVADGNIAFQAAKSGEGCHHRLAAVSGVLSASDAYFAFTLDRQGGGRARTAHQEVGGVETHVAVPVMAIVGRHTLAYTYDFRAGDVAARAALPQRERNSACRFVHDREVAKDDVLARRACIHSARRRCRIQQVCRQRVGQRDRPEVECFVLHFLSPN